MQSLSQASSPAHVRGYRREQIREQVELAQQSMWYAAGGVWGLCLTVQLLWVHDQWGA